MSIPAWPLPGRPAKGGKTVVRAGFGTYHEDGQLDDQNLPAKNEVPSYSPSKSIEQLCSVTYPVDPYCHSAPGTISPNAEQRDRKDTYVEQWSFSVQRELPANFVGTVSYLGSHGVHLLETNVVNLIDPATGVAQYPAFATRHRLARLGRHEHRTTVSPWRCGGRSPRASWWRQITCGRMRSTTAPTAAATATR